MRLRLRARKYGAHQQVSQSYGSGRASGFVSSLTQRPVSGPWALFDDAPKGVADVRVLELENILSITDLADEDGHGGEKNDGESDD